MIGAPRYLDSYKINTNIMEIIWNAINKTIIYLLK